VGGITGSGVVTRHPRSLAGSAQSRSPTRFPVEIEFHARDIRTESRPTNRRCSSSVWDRGRRRTRGPSHAKWKRDPPLSSSYRGECRETHEDSHLSASANARHRRLSTDRMIAMSSGPRRVVESGSSQTCQKKMSTPAVLLLRSTHGYRMTIRGMAFGGNVGCGRCWSVGRSAGFASGVQRSVAVAVAIVTAGVAAGLSLAGAVDATSAVHSRVSARRGLASLPLAAQPVVSDALGGDDPAYRVLGLRAANPAQRLRLAFSASGATLSTRSTRVRLSLVGFGYASAVRPVVATRPVATSNKVSYAHPGVREWYANGPLGLEQAFSVLRRPSVGSGPLTLSVALSGDVASRLEHGSVILGGGHGVRLRYGGLRVTDASGRTLRSWLELQPGRVLIRVDDRGARYPLRVDPFVQDAELGGGGESEPAFPVAISGQTIAVGAPKDNDFRGVVDVFTESNGGWANPPETARLTASAGNAGNELGWSVAISGETIVAGAPDNQVGGPADQGAVYVFTEPDGGWVNGTQTAELTASDGAADDHLGTSVGIDGTTIVAGAPDDEVGGNDDQGTAYLFTEPGGGWVNGTQTAELTASDGAAGDELGSSVAISGETIVAGAPDHEVGNNNDQGAAYMYTEPGGGWTDGTQTAELTGSDGAADDHLGTSVAIDAQTVVAGAPDHEVGNNDDQGAAYVYTQPGGGWTDATQTAELTASDGNATDELGSSVAISGETVVAGAPGHEVGNNADYGVADVYTEPGGGWTDATQSDELIASEGYAANTLGTSVAISGQVIAAGAPFEGAAYVFGVGAVASPSLSTAGPSSGTSGNAITASSITGTLSGGGAPTGTITFTVFGPQSTAPTSCASGGTTVGTAAVSNDGTYQSNASFTPSSAGDYWWYASYGGDSSNNSGASICGGSMAETVVSGGTPSLSVSAPTSTPVDSGFDGSGITGTVSGGVGPTGTITFTVFGPRSTAPTDCTSGGATIGTTEVSGDGTYQSNAGFTPSSTGDYWWYASYGGDSINDPTNSGCGASMAETVVTPQTPSLSLAAPSSDATGAPFPKWLITGGLSFGVAPTGTITFTVFGPQSAAPTNCASGGTVVGTADVSNDGTYEPNATRTPSSAGDYWWYASYSGDSNNNPTNSGCAESMPKTVVTAPVVGPVLGLYWSTAAGTIAEANTAGTGVNENFITGGSPWSLAIGGSELYWGNNGNETIGSANLEGADVNQATITGASAVGLAIDGPQIYWSDTDGGQAGKGTILEANIDGSDVNASFIKGLTDPRELAVSGSRIYWTNASGIGVANLDGTGVDPRFIPAGQPSGLAVTGQYIYWTNPGNQLPGQGTIGRANLDGSGVDDSLITGLDDPGGIAVSGTSIYWTGGTSIGTANLDGSAVDMSFITGTAVGEQIVVSAPATTKPALSIAHFTNVTAKRTANVTLSCKDTTGRACKGTLTLAKGKSLFGSLSIDLGARKQETLKITLSKLGYAKVESAGGHKLTLTWKFEPATGAATYGTLTLVGPKPN
jgi:hypothetical protein